ncbi:MAG: helix-turn-helix domain-containing protein [Candidatus Sulfotelmatobacter sp.]
MDILTLDDVAAILKLKRSAVYEMTRVRSQARQEHPIPFIRVAGHLRFRRQDIENWLTELAGEKKAA